GGRPRGAHPTRDRPLRRRHGRGPQPTRRARRRSRRGRAGDQVTATTSHGDPAAVEARRRPRGRPRGGGAGPRAPPPPTPGPPAVFEAPPGGPAPKAGRPEPLIFER